MVWFDFQSPPRTQTDRIQFEDEDGRFALTDLLDAGWLRLTSLEPVPNWPEWYVVVSRLVSYASEVCLDTCQRIDTWATQPDASSAAGYVFCDDNGKVSLAAVVGAIERWRGVRPSLARRLVRLIIHIAERRHRGDRIAWSILEQAGLQFEDV